MADKIPIENIYYLLSYSWDYFTEGEEIDISTDACPDLANLLGRVLANGIRRLARTGFERNYLPRRETLSRLRGRILVGESYRAHTDRRAKMICEFDELDGDTASNRILSETTRRLLGLRELTPEIRHEIRVARSLLPEVTPSRVSDASFQRIQLHRNTRNYRLLLSVCRLIHRGLLPDEQDGSRRFRDILRDELVMHRLFESFVLNFARRHCGKANIRAMPIQWDGEWDDEAAQVLPSMITDVTLEWPERKVILDCKFYKEALVTREGRHRLHSTHLYQLNAYLQNKSRQLGWEEVEGILLYPAVKHHLDVRMELLGHRFRIVSIDLDQNWTEIERDLLGVLEPTTNKASTVAKRI
ncbi:5-methylcytosine restriction system specificity protein McrC [Haloferula sp.]|uniref:5-methylcytosine restriction system specificity protein McrC n=1 Tax=Haloferula sp. TaxID=2497595 RepID=UPI00329D0079